MIPIPEWSVVERYLRTERKTEEDTIEHYKSRYAAIARYTNSLSRDGLIAVVESLKLLDRENSYINKIIITFKIICKMMKVSGVEDFTFYQETNKAYDVLTPIEIDKILHAKPNKKYRDCYWERCTIAATIQAYTGMRIQEVQDLRPGDYRNDTFYVRGKGHKDRFVPVVQKLAEEIAWYRNLESPEDTLISEFSQQKYNSELKLRTKLCNVNKHVTTHTFRRSFITTLITCKVPITRVAEIVGHSDINTTKIYDKANIDDLRKCLERHPLLVPKPDINSIYLRIQEVVQDLVPNFKIDLRKTDSGVRLFIAE